MWQRFSENARLTIFYAQEQAARFGTTKVSTEHLLLGLLHQAEQPGVWPPPPIEQVESGNAAAFVLREIGADIAALRAQVEYQSQIGIADPSQDWQLATEGKRVIDIAYNEARSLNHNYIGTEHLLLGLIREEKGIAGRVLSQMGVSIAPARSVVSNLVSGTNTQASIKRTFWQILFGRYTS